MADSFERPNSPPVHGALWNGVSAFVHLAILAASALSVPAMSGFEDETVDGDRLEFLKQTLAAAAERDVPFVPPHEGNEDRPTPSPVDTSSGGSLGEPRAAPADRHYAVAGPTDNADPHLASRRGLLEEAGHFGMVTALAGAEGAPLAPWGRDDSLGNDAANARGNLWGAAVGDAFGAGGLGLTGVGECGCGTGQGVALGSIGTIGHTGGRALRDALEAGPDGFYYHRHPVPTLRPSPPSVSGSLPADVIDRVVRLGLGRARLCYEVGLRDNPALGGRVVVSFVVGRDGQVANAHASEADLADAHVTACIARAFYGLSFPEPQGGVVTVHYPIVLLPR